MTPATVYRVTLPQTERMAPYRPARKSEPPVTSAPVLIQPRAEIPGLSAPS